MSFVPEGVAPVVFRCDRLHRCCSDRCTGSRVGTRPNLPVLLPQEIQIARIEPAAALDQLKRAGHPRLFGSAPAVREPNRRFWHSGNRSEAFVVVTAIPGCSIRPTGRRVHVIDRAVAGTVPRSGFVFSSLPGHAAFHADYFQHFGTGSLRLRSAIRPGAPANAWKGLHSGS